MERRVLGKTGMSVSVLGFGGSETGYGGHAVSTVAKILNSALDDGLNLIDTAACYGDGEDQIGRAVSHRRQEFFLLTKCGHASGGLRGNDWDPAMMAKSIDRSLKRLRTDYVDVMQLHSCSAETLRDDKVIGVLRRACEAGKTRFIGYSGDGSDALHAVESGIFDTLQISVSIADQEAIDLVLPRAHERRMGVIVKRPIANAVWLDRKAATDWYSRPYWERLQKLDYDFLRDEPASSIATALRFTLSTGSVHTAIVGTTKPRRWQQNASLAAEGNLPRDRYEAIRSRWRTVARPDWIGQR
ncbi:MAG: aldo/keto reductase [Candidatus Binataceae bacterium]